MQGNERSRDNYPQLNFDLVTIGRLIQRSRENHILRIFSEHSFRISFSFRQDIEQYFPLVYEYYYFYYLKKDI